MSATAPDARPLVGRVVRLDPMVAGDAPALFEALDDERVYAAGYGGGPAGRPADADGMQATTASAVRDRELRPGHPSYRVAYTVRLVADGDLGAAGTVVGTTSLGDVVVGDEKAHIGWTGYGPRWWATAVNPECKLLLLGHAFDDCRLGRVKLQTDVINTRSQAAIAKLGATREGVLRRHKRRADGTFRDTVVFSILRDEWPDVRDGLLARLP
ncbi:GNAT family N-acetyltransferase [Angustibacter luteus]|uniref:GNAT family protein n=1 Tax=Angustibacter luteus TaxID=658456 RepID=A0ABW1JEM7_9ACTN